MGCRLSCSPEDSQGVAQLASSYRHSSVTHSLALQTAEGSRLELVSSSDKTDRVVVSTLMEAWEVVNAGLVADGTVKDVS